MLLDIRLENLENESHQEEVALKRNNQHLLMDFFQILISETKTTNGQSLTISPHKP